MRLKGGAVRCDVVGDKLSKERPSSRLASERRVGILGITAITEAPRASERVEKFLVCGKGRKIPKQARVRARSDALIRTRAGRRQTMRMFHMEIIDAVVARSPHPIGTGRAASASRCMRAARDRDSSQSTFSIEIGNERIRLPVA